MATGEIKTLQFSSGTTVVSTVYPLEVGTPLTGTQAVNVDYLTSLGAGIKNNITATVAPTINDDSGDGYSVGSFWINVTADLIYQAVDVTLGAAIWKPIVDTNSTQVLSNKSFSTPVAISDTTQSTTKDTGCLVIEGGLGVEKNLNVGGDLNVTGNFTVLGTTTTVNSTVLDVVDPNITVNKGGTVASANASFAGLTVETDTTNARIAYDSTLASKFKVGNVGSEKQIVTDSDVMNVINKNFDDTNTYTSKDTLFTLEDNGDTTKKVRFELAGITTATTRTIPLPDANSSLVNLDSTQTLSSKTLDNTNTLNIKDTLFTLQDDGDATKKARFELSALTTATTRTFSLPDANTAIVGTDTVQFVSNKFIAYSTTNDAATGSNQTLSAFTVGIIRLTSGTLASLSGIPAGSSGQALVLENKTGVTIIINNEQAGASASDRIQTGSGTNLNILNNASLTLIYDITSARWQVTGFSSPATLTPPTIQKFLSGSGTYTKPANVLHIRVIMAGAGGGSGGSATAGNGGAGGTGGNTTFGTTLLVANGGVGASGIPGDFGGAGGTASLGSGPIGLALSGGEGAGSNSVTSTMNSGPGGQNPFGGASGGSTSNGGGRPGADNTGAGAAGAGGGATRFAGNGGGAGGYVNAIITSPSATYSYAVGAAGSAGAAGTGGIAGAAGGSGVIVVEEYYQ